MKTSDPAVRHIDMAPATGIYRLTEDGTLEYQRNTLDWHYLNDPEESFFLRVYGVGNYLFKGADLGILVTKSRMQTEDGELTPRCRQLIDGIHSYYKATDINTPPPTSYLAYLK